MKLSEFLFRVHGKYQRTVADLFSKRNLKMQNSGPYISFTFDDFPISALYTGGAILRSFELRGTYYASFGLMGTKAPTGNIFSVGDIKELLSQKHELGCHTFSHAHAWETNATNFEESIVKNKLVLEKLFPGIAFRSFSYPIGVPRPITKRRASKHFLSCRCGGQIFNSDIVDLNYLKAFFLEKSRDNPHLVKKIIDRNCQAQGWLIFATHDVSEEPTPYGCTPSFFKDIVKYSIDSGAKILPVTEVVELIMLSFERISASLLKASIIYLVLSIG